MGSTLSTNRVQAVLIRLRRIAESEDEPAKLREFGTSLGYSTIHFASALQDLGRGWIVTTELLADKARHASKNVAEAGLSGYVEVRRGDALETLADVDRDVDLLFLDGSNDLYLSVLELVEPRLAARALIVADVSPDEPHHARYRDYVNDPARGYLTTEIPIDAGIVVSTAVRRVGA